MNVNIIHEKKLLEKVSRGDEVAFRKLFDQYKESFYGAALKMTRSPGIAEEIVQEVFVSLWTHRSNLAAVNHPSSYLFTIVYNKIAAHFKKLAREQHMKAQYLQTIPQSAHLTELMVEENENLRIVQNIITQLPDQQQLIYKMSKQDGLSRNEIAEQLQLSPHTVKNHLLQAVKHIRQHLKTLSVLLSIWCLWCVQFFFFSH